MSIEYEHAALQLLRDAAASTSKPIDTPNSPSLAKMVVPFGYEVKDIPRIDPLLTHIKETVSVLSVDAFIDYIDRYKTEHTQIFADHTAPRIVGIIDYHDKDGKPQYCDHVVTFSPLFTEQWTRWRNAQRSPMDQRNFAEFIEENYLDVVEPEAATLLEMVTNLNSTTKVSFESSMRLADGSNSLSYVEETTARGKGKLDVPSEITLGVPIFYEGDPYKIRTLLRSRIKDGVARFEIKINREEFLVQKAFSDIVEIISLAIEMKPYAGSVPGVDLRRIKSR